MSDRIRVIVADDESPAREHLTALLDALDASVVASCSDGRELCEAVSQLSPDALFIDIEMPELDGVSPSRRFRWRGVLSSCSSPRTTSSPYAPSNLEAVDYVLKPSRKERIVRALERVQRALAAAPPDPPTVNRRGERFIVMSPGRMSVIHEWEIDYVEAERNYVRLHTADRHPLVRETMRAVEQRLDGEQFVPTHRSFLVRVPKIRNLIQKGGDYVAEVEPASESSGTWLLHACPAFRSRPCSAPRAGNEYGPASRFSSVAARRIATA